MTRASPRPEPTDHVCQNNKEDFSEKSTKYVMRAEYTQRWFGYRAGKRWPASPPPAVGRSRGSPWT